MSTLREIKSYTTQEGHFYGNIAQMDFNRWGKIEIVFYVGQQSVGVEVAGLLSTRMLKFKPANEREKAINQEFYNRYVLPCHNAVEVMIDILNAAIELKNQ